MERPADLDTNAVQPYDPSTWPTLREAARVVNKSEKTIRRYIQDERLDSSAVHREKTPGGFRYRVNLEALQKVVDQVPGAVQPPDWTADLERIGSQLDKGLDRVGSRLEALVQPIQQEIAELRGMVERALPPAQPGPPPIPEVEPVELKTGPEQEPRPSWWSRLWRRGE